MSTILRAKTDAGKGDRKIFDTSVESFFEELKTAVGSPALRTRGTMPKASVKTSAVVHMAGEHRLILFRSAAGDAKGRRATWFITAMLDSRKPRPGRVRKGWAHAVLARAGYCIRHRMPFTLPKKNKGGISHARERREARQALVTERMVAEAQAAVRLKKKAKSDARQAAYESRVRDAKEAERVQVLRESDNPLGYTKADLSRAAAASGFRPMESDEDPEEYCEYEEEFMSGKASNALREGEGRAAALAAGDGEANPGPDRRAWARSARQARRKAHKPLIEKAAHRSKRQALLDTVMDGDVESNPGPPKGAARRARKETDDGAALAAAAQLTLERDRLAAEREAQREKDEEEAAARREQEKIDKHNALCDASLSALPAGGHMVWLSSDKAGEKVIRLEKDAEHVDGDSPLPWHWPISRAFRLLLRVLWILFDLCALLGVPLLTSSSFVLMGTALFLGVRCSWRLYWCVRQYWYETMRAVFPEAEEWSIRSAYRHSVTLREQNAPPMAGDQRMGRDRPVTRSEVRRDINVHYRVEAIEIESRLFRPIARGWWGSYYLRAGLVVIEDTVEPESETLLDSHFTVGSDQLHSILAVPRGISSRHLNVMRAAAGKHLAFVDARPSASMSIPGALTVALAVWASAQATDSAAFLTGQDADRCVS